MWREDRDVQSKDRRPRERERKRERETDKPPPPPCCTELRVLRDAGIENIFGTLSCFGQSKRDPRKFVCRWQVAFDSLSNISIALFSPQTQLEIVSRSTSSNDLYWIVVPRLIYPVVCLQQILKCRVELQSLAFLSASSVAVPVSRHESQAGWYVAVRPDNTACGSVTAQPPGPLAAAAFHITRPKWRAGSGVDTQARRRGRTRVTPEWKHNTITQHTHNSRAVTQVINLSF